MRNNVKVDEGTTGGDAREILTLDAHILHLTNKVEGKSSGNHEWPHWLDELSTTRTCQRTRITGKQGIRTGVGHLRMPRKAIV